MRHTSGRWCSALFVAACGCVAKVDGETAASMADGETSHDTGESDDGATSDETGDVLASPPACLHDPGALRITPYRAWVTDGENEIDLVTHGSPLNGGAAGNFIAVISTTPTSDFASVFDRYTGELLWSRAVFSHWGLLDPGHMYWIDVFVAEDGQTIAATVWPGPLDFTPSTSSAVALITPADDVVFDSNASVIAGPALGYVALKGITQAGWRSLDGQVWHPALPASPLGITVGEDGHTLYYEVPGDEQDMYVRARIGESKSMLLAQEGEPIPHHADFYVKRYGGCGDPTWFRHDLETGDALLIDPEPPLGWSFVGCQALVDLDGTTMFFMLSQGTEARLWAYEIENDAWQAVGSVFSHCENPIGYAGFWLNWVSDDIFMVTVNCWPGEEDLVFDLVRRDTPLSLRLETTVGTTWDAGDTWHPSPSLIQIDSTQRCAALEVEGGWEVWSLDGSNEVIHVPGTGSWSWLD